MVPASEEIERGHVLPEAVSTHTITVEAASTVGPDLARATRLIATDLFHAFGSAEVRQIAADGGLRTRYLGGDGELRAWAQGHGIDVSDETVTGGVVRPPRDSAPAERAGPRAHRSLGALSAASTS